MDSRSCDIEDIDWDTFDPEAEEGEFLVARPPTRPIDKRTVRRTTDG